MPHHPLPSSQPRIICFTPVASLRVWYCSSQKMKITPNPLLFNYLYSLKISHIYALYFVISVHDYLIFTPSGHLYPTSPPASCPPDFIVINNSLGTVCVAPIWGQGGRGGRKHVRAGRWRIVGCLDSGNAVHLSIHKSCGYLHTMESVKTPARIGEDGVSKFPPLTEVPLASGGCWIYLVY